MSPQETRWRQEAADGLGGVSSRHSHFGRVLYKSELKFNTAFFRNAAQFSGQA